MTQSAVAFTDAANGRQRQTDGIWVHKGKISVGPPGQGDAPALSGDLNLSRGNGTAVLYFAGERPGSRYLFFDGTNYQLVGGSLNAKLAPGTAQAHLISYLGAPNWSTPAAGAWYETPVGGTATFTGVECRIEASFNWGNNTAGAISQWGWGVDGAAQAALVRAHTPSANFLLNSAFIVYATIPAGVHRIALLVNTNAGVTSLDAGTNNNFHVTEQRA